MSRPNRRREVEIRDRNGNHLGYVSHGFTAEDIAEAHRRRESPEPRLTTKEVLERIQSVVDR